MTSQQEQNTRIDALEKELAAKNNELHIEAALEKVRSRTMAMQKSEELSETAYILFQQFKELGESPIQITIGIFNEEKSVIEFRVTGFDGSKIEQGFNMSLDEPTLIHKIYTSWKENKRSATIELTGKELLDWLTYRSKIAGVTESVTNITAGERRFVSVGFFSKGLISISKPDPIAEATIQILERFAGVFDLTYTRFLDLKQAEAQGREAQIQLAMERVRARTMAMQKSIELTDAADLLFQQVQLLGVRSWNCGFHIWDEDKRHATAWMGTKQGVFRSFKTSSSEEIFHRFYEAAQRGESLYVEELGGEALQAHHRYMATLPVVGDAVKALTASGIELPALLIYHIAYFSQGYLLFITHQPCPEMWNIFKRFAKVFEQTYTRFLDLQKAEAQARESQIQLGT